MNTKNMFDTIVCFPFNPDKFAKKMEAMEEQLSNLNQARTAVQEKESAETGKPVRNTDNSIEPMAASSADSPSTR